MAPFVAAVSGLAVRGRSRRKLTRNLSPCENRRASLAGTNSVPTPAISVCETVSA